MKKIYLFLILFLIIIFFPEKNSLADIIPLNQKLIPRCVKIDNLYLFPNISLLVLEKRVIEGNDRVYEIVDDQCLKREYKANQLKIYWNIKGNFKAEEDKILIDSVEPFYITVEENDPLISEEIIYSLTKDAQGKIRLYKSKEIKRYRNRQTKTVDFKNPYSVILSPTLSTNISQKVSVAPTKTLPSFDKEKNFLEIIFCWIKRLFGFNCQ